MHIGSTQHNVKQCTWFTTCLVQDSPTTAATRIPVSPQCTQGLGTQPQGGQNPPPGESWLMRAASTAQPAHITTLHTGPGSSAMQPAGQRRAQQYAARRSPQLAGAHRLLQPPGRPNRHGLNAGVERARAGGAGAHSAALAPDQSAGPCSKACTAAPAPALPTHSSLRGAARSRPPPPCPPGPRLNSCCGRRGCPRRRGLGLAACARYGSFAPSLHSRPDCIRARIERQRRGSRGAPGAAGRGVRRVRAPPRARAAPRAPGRLRGPRSRRRRARTQQRVPLVRGLLGLRARGRSAASLRLQLGPQPRLRRLGCSVRGRGVRALASWPHAQTLHGCRRDSTKHSTGCSLVGSVRRAPPRQSLCQEPRRACTAAWWHGAPCVVKVCMRHMPGGAGLRACAHPPDAQRQRLAHGGLPLLAARLVQRGQPLPGCRLRLDERLGPPLGAPLVVRLPHLDGGFLIMKAWPMLGQHACHHSS